MLLPWSQLSEIEFMQFCRGFEFAFLTQLFKDYSNCIFDMGGGNGLLDDKEQIALCKQIAHVENKFVLIPFQDFLDSMLWLNTNKVKKTKGNTGFSLNELSLNREILNLCNENPYNCKKVYINNRTVSETAEEVVKLLV